MVEYHCPICFFIPIFDIQNDYENIEIKCINNHIFKYKISDFLGKNPFGSPIIKCSNCLNQENNISNSYFCIQCRKNICQNDKNNQHKNCKNIISLEQLYCTCLEHNSPLIKLCKSCNKEVCCFCILKGHNNHILSEEIYEIIERIKFLKRNELIEKFIMDKLISENITQNKDKIKKIYNNLIKLKKFFNNIFLKEISNQRYSNILYINIFIIYHALDKLKKEVKPKIQECFKLIDNNEI